MPTMAVRVKHIWSCQKRSLDSALGACPRIRLGQNLTSQNAPESTIGDLGGVLLPPKMPIFAFLGQAPRRTIMTQTTPAQEKYTRFSCPTPQCVRFNHPGEGNIVPRSW